MFALFPCRIYSFNRKEQYLFSLSNVKQRESSIAFIFYFKAYISNKTRNINHSDEQGYQAFKLKNQLIYRFQKTNQFIIALISQFRWILKNGDFFFNYCFTVSIVCECIYANLYQVSKNNFLKMIDLKMLIFASKNVLFKSYFMQ